MKRFFSFFALLAILFGAGCDASPRPQSATPTDRRPAWLIPREGIAIVTKANLDAGPRVSVTDAATGRILTTELPSMFADGQGTYTTNKPGEMIRVQLAVGGSVENDRKLFGDHAGFERFEDGTLAEWKVTAAYQTAERRWVIRAAKKDAIQQEGMYHVIECVGTEDTDNLFWDGCRTMIEKAAIDQSRAPSPQ